MLALYCTWLLLSDVTIERGGDTVKEAMAVALEDLLLYNDDSVLLLLFLVALMILWFVERDRRIRTVLMKSTVSNVCATSIRFPLQPILQLPKCLSPHSTAATLTGESLSIPARSTTDVKKQTFNY